MATKKKIYTGKDRRKVKPVAERKLERAFQLLDNLVRAVESADQNSMVQAAGAGREYLDTNGER